MRGEETEKQERNKVFSTKTKYSSKYCRDTIVTNNTVSDLAKKIGDLTADTSRACFIRESKENKCSCDIFTITGRIHTQVQSIHHECEQKKNVMT